MQNFVNLNDLSTSEITSLIATSLAYKTKEKTVPQTKQHVANLFFENSTRTASSFQMAESQLGWSRIIVNPQTSSTQKGRL